MVCWNHLQLNCGSVTKFMECFSNICLQSSERSQVLRRAWFVAMSKNEASGANKTKKLQRSSPVSQDQGELGQSSRQWDGVEGNICAIGAANLAGGVWYLNPSGMLLGFRVFDHLSWLERLKTHFPG